MSDYVMGTPNAYEAGEGKGSKKTLWIILAVAAILIVCCCCFAIIAAIVAAASGLLEEMQYLMNPLLSMI